MSISKMEARTRIIGSDQKLFETDFLQSIGCVDAVNYWVRLIANGHDSFVSTMRLALNHYVDQMLSTFNVDTLIDEIGFKDERPNGILRCLYPNPKELAADQVLKSDFPYRVMSALYGEGKKGKVPFVDPTMLGVLEKFKPYIIDPTLGNCAYSTFFATTGKVEAANIDTIFSRTADDIARYYASFASKDDRDSVKRCIQNGNVKTVPSTIRSKCDAAVKMMERTLGWTDGTATEHVKSMMKRPNFITRQRLLVLRLWLMMEIRADGKESFSFTVFPRPFGPLQPPITLSVEHQGSHSIFSNFKNLLKHYATNMKNNSVANDAKFKLSAAIANFVEAAPVDVEERIEFFIDLEKCISEKLKLLTPVKVKSSETSKNVQEQLSQKHKQELRAFINFSKVQEIRLRGDRVEHGNYRCQKSKFAIFRSWSMTGTRGDIVLANGSITKHVDRADNGIVDVLEEIMAYASRSECLGDLEMPPFLYACLVAPFPIAYAVLKKLNRQEDPVYDAIILDLQNHIKLLFQILEKKGITSGLDSKYSCGPEDRDCRIDWMMEGYERLLEMDEISESVYFEEIQTRIKGTIGIKYPKIRIMGQMEYLVWTAMLLLWFFAKDVSLWSRRYSKKVVAANYL